MGNPPDARVFETQSWQNLLGRIEQAVAAFHDTRPGSPGATPRDIQVVLKPHFELAVIEAAVDELVIANRLGRNGARVHLPSHAIQVSAADRQLWSQATALLAPQSGSPLSLHQAGEALGIRVSLLEKSLKHAVKSGSMLQLAKNRYAPSAYVAELARAAESIAEASADGDFTVAEYCKRIETGRNFAIDLLEYFDRLGFTERSGNQRRIRRPADSVFAMANDQP